MRPQAGRSRTHRFEWPLPACEWQKHVATLTPPRTANKLDVLTPEIVDAARESLLIGH